MISIRPYVYRNTRTGEDVFQTHAYNLTEADRDAERFFGKSIMSKMPELAVTSPLWGGLSLGYDTYGETP